MDKTNNNNENKKKKRAGILLLLLLFIILCILIFNIFNSSKKYNVKKNPLVNMITIENLIYNSSICDEKWLAEVADMITLLEDESLTIRHINSNDSDYKKKLDNLSYLQSDVSKNLKNLYDYITNNNITSLDNTNNVLISNVNTSYNAYKDYYKSNILEKN